MDSTEILSILERAHFYSQQLHQKREIPKILRNKLVANLFFENSTRTRFSFEVAAKRLGASVLNFSPETSSMAKGESLYDTLKTFESFGVDIAIIRHSDDSYVESIKDQFNFQIVNAGAGKFEHPSQSLLDLLTIHQEFGTVSDLTVSICGDVSTSRVAKSNMAALAKFNSKVLLSGPKELMPTSTDLAPHCQVVGINEAFSKSDVIMLLRVQHERHHLFELNIENYNQDYGLNDQRIKMLKPASIILHPGPFNRDVEISSGLVEHPQSRIFKQVENGVFTRMAILEWIVS